MDAHRSLEERLCSNPEPWKPRPDQMLIGTVVEIETREAGYGPYPVVVVLTDDGRELAWHAFHTVARAELARVAPKIGDRIGVRFDGKDPEKKYAKWKVVADHADPQAPDWQAMRAEAESELAAAEEPVHDETDDIPF
jgi:hypothetical protein